MSSVIVFLTDSWSSHIMQVWLGLASESPGSCLYLLNTWILGCSHLSIFLCGYGGWTQVRMLVSQVLHQLYCYSSPGFIPFVTFCCLGWVLQKSKKSPFFFSWAMKTPSWSPLMGRQQCMAGDWESSWPRVDRVLTKTFYQWQRLQKNNDSINFCQCSLTGIMSFHLS